MPPDQTDANPTPASLPDHGSCSPVRNATNIPAELKSAEENSAAENTSEIPSSDLLMHTSPASISPANVSSVDISSVNISPADIPSANISPANISSANTSLQSSIPSKSQSPSFDAQRSPTATQSPASKTREIVRPFQRREKLKTIASTHIRRKTPQSPSTLSIGEKADHILEALGIRFPYTVFRRIFLRKRENGEKPEVVIANSRTVAILSSLIHVLPVGAVWFIYTVNSRGYYLGSEIPGVVGHTQEKEYGLQLAAKFHELTMQASLGTVVFATVRYLLMTEKGVPFAAMSAGFQWTSVSFLWSPDFWSIAFSGKTFWLKRTMLLVILTLCVLLGVSVGPASAVSLHPQLDWWEAGGATIWINSTMDRLFPQMLNETNISGPQCATAGTDGCPSESWETLKDWFVLPKLLEVPSDYGTIYQRRDPIVLYLRAGDVLQIAYIKFTEHDEADDGYRSSATAVTMPHAVIANALAENLAFWDRAAGVSRDVDGTHYYNRQEADFELWLYQPVVRVLRNETIYGGDSPDPRPYFPSNVSSTNATANGIPSSASQYQDWIKDNFNSEQKAAGLHWISGDPKLSNLDPETYGELQAAALVTLPFKESSGGKVVSCAVSAKYVTARVYQDINEAIGTDIDNLEDFGDFAVTVSSAKHRFTMIDPSWANYLNPSIPSLNSSVFEQVAISAGVWDPESGATDAPTPRIEGILAMLLAYGMANTDPTAKVQGQIKNYHNGSDAGYWWREFLPQPQPGQSPGHGGEPYDVTDTQKQEFFGTYMKVQMKGYAWSMKARPSMQLAVGILLAYAGIAMARMLQLFLSRTHCNAWETVNDVVALALASEPPQDALRNTAAGISTTRTVGQPLRVSIRDGRLQFVFVHDEQVHERIREGVRY
jgi:hypothetical protein